MLFIVSVVTITVGGVSVVFLKEKKTKRNGDWFNAVEKTKKEKTVSQKKYPILFSKNLRTQQLQEISSAAGEAGVKLSPEISGIEQKTKQYFIVSSASLAVATVGLIFYAPLTLVSVPITLYAFTPIVKDAYQDLKDLFAKKPRLTMNIVDGVIMVGMLATGSFFTSALTMTFIWLSQGLLLKAEDHAQKSLIDVFSERPRFVWLVKDEAEAQSPLEIEILFEELNLGDIIVVHAGELIPVDGIITQGNATIDQRILTGEAQPAEKEPGDQVFASTVVLAGEIQLMVEETGQDTVAAQIGVILNRTADFTNTLEWEWKQVVNNLSPLTLISGLIVWPILGPGAAVSMLISVNFGYSMRVVAPLTLLNFLNASSKNSILIKDGRALEVLRKIDTIVFDKTGTLTQEIPTVGQIYALGGYSENEILMYAAAAEYKQTHPIALAILQEAQKRHLNLPQINTAHYEIGYGLKVKIDEADSPSPPESKVSKVIRVGSPRFMALEALPVSAEIEQIQQESHENGHSLICVAIDDQIEGIIELIPTIRPEAKHIITQLRERGLALYIISGDHEKPTQRLAAELGIAHYFAETLPEKKSDHIEKLQAEGKCVCFVGDGINDAIALKKANLSISLQGASSVALDTASIILMDKSLNKLILLFEIAQACADNMKNSFIISTIPTITSIGGVLFLNLRIISTTVLYFAGLSVGMSNSMLPLIKPQEEKSITTKSNRV